MLRKLAGIWLVSVGWYLGTRAAPDAGASQFDMFRGAMAVLIFGFLGVITALPGTPPEQKKP